MKTLKSIDEVIKAVWDREEKVLLLEMKKNERELVAAFNYILAFKGLNSRISLLPRISCGFLSYPLIYLSESSPEEVSLVCYELDNVTIGSHSKEDCEYKLYGCMSDSCFLGWAKTSIDFSATEYVLAIAKTKTLLSIIWES